LITQQFSALMRDRDLNGLSDWMHKATATGIPAMKFFVKGLRRDQAAVNAAFSLPWSNGPGRRPSTSSQAHQTADVWTSRFRAASPPRSSFRHERRAPRSMSIIKFAEEPTLKYRNQVRIGWLTARQKASQEIRSHPPPGIVLVTKS